MAIYLYECENEECKYETEEIVSYAKRDDDIVCSKCGSDMKRKFNTRGNQVIMWRDPGDTAPSCVGPTRRMNYTIGDIAKEHGWYEKMGIKES